MNVIEIKKISKKTKQNIPYNTNIKSQKTNTMKIFTKTKKNKLNNSNNNNGPAYHGIKSLK